MNLEQAIRVIRIARLSNRALKARRRTRAIFDAQQHQTNGLIDVADTIRAIRDKQVIASDVHASARLVVKAAPTVYRRIASITRNQRRPRRRNAKT